jgi:predicted metalloprotease with PDZ domain
MPIAPVRYRITMPAPQRHEFWVTLTVPPLPDRDSVTLSFPAWAPGSYLIRDFSRHLYDLEFQVGRKTVDAERLDKLSWRIRTDGKPLVVRYRVFANEVSVRTSFLDDRRAFISGSSLFFQVTEEPERPYEITVVPPPRWQISTPLDSVGKHVFRARDYDELVDSPFEVGTHTLHAFRVGHTRFEVAFCGKTNAHLPRLLQDLQAIVHTTGTMFGGYPFARYLFIIHALPARGGGLEHANACTLDIHGYGFEDEKGYQSFNELAAHEFFHAWNVKRIHDRTLGPFDYTRENYTRLLWFHEGVTEYMQSILLLRAGLLTRETYLKDLAEAWERYSQRPGRNITPLSELSFEAWIKQYKPADNHQNRMVSYYEKGKWAGLLLDLSLLSATKGRHGLPSLFLRLWKQYARLSKPIDEAVLRDETSAIAGRSMQRFFSQYIDGTFELPITRTLGSAGISVTNQPVKERESHDPTRKKRLLGYSGLSLNGTNPGQAAIVKNVVPGSPGDLAGITFGDEIVAVGGMRVTQATVCKRLADYSPGDALPIAFFRYDELNVTTLRMVRNPERRFIFTQNPKASPASRFLCKRWLG